MQLAVALVQVEALLPCGIKQSLFEHILRGILGKLQIMHTSIDRRVDEDRLRFLFDDRESRMEVSQATRRQRATACHKLDKCLQIK